MSGDVNSLLARLNCAGRVVACRKVNQRAVDTIQQNLETEARLKMEAVVVRKKLEQDITELEITLEGVNKARADAEKNWKQCQQEVDDLETLLEEEQKSKFDQHCSYTSTEPKQFSLSVFSARSNIHCVSKKRQ